METNGNCVKMAKDLNNTSLEELISSLRSHEIELQEDEPQKKGKSIALRSKTEKARTYLAEEESEESDEDSDEDELSLISRKLHQLWKHGKSKFRGLRKIRGITESTHCYKKAYGKETTCFECKEPGHIKSECPKLKKESKPKKAYKAKKSLMATWDDSDSEEVESDEEHGNIALMAKTGREVLSEDELISDEESDSDDDREVLSSLSHSELESGLS